MVEINEKDTNQGTKRKADEIGHDDDIEYGHYGNVISDAKALKYANGEIPRPIQQLQKALDKTKNARTNSIKPGDCVIHWFRMDQRTGDNRALSGAFRLAQTNNIPLICVFLVNFNDWKRHLRSNIQADFIMRSLKVLHKDLYKLNIPLIVEATQSYSRIIDLAKQYNCKHIFANIEYEVDELRRDARLVEECMKENIAMNLEHDSCVVNPTELFTKTSDKPFSVFTPFYKAWVAHLCQHMSLLDETPKLSELPAANVPNGLLKESVDLPELPSDMQSLSNDFDESHGPEYWEKLWPAGEHVALEKLENYASSKLKSYKHDRDFLNLEDATAGLSVYIAAGNIATRTAVRRAVNFEHSTGKIGILRSTMDMNSSGAANWTSEIAWRDFYRNIVVNFPYVCMNKPFKLKTGQIKWSNDRANFEKWCQGKTGFPVVDAAMRQLLQTGYMHNRGRMIVASFLTKHLLINWQWGERFFMKHLIDGDFASNNGGWGFASSCGVDAQPYFRIFNPYRQSERFDADGSYIRKYVPELRGIESNTAIHEPYARGAGSIARNNDYPEPMVSHQKARQVALDTFKAVV